MRVERRMKQSARTAYPLSDRGGMHGKVTGDSVGLEG